MKRIARWMMLTMVCGGVSFGQDEAEKTAPKKSETVPQADAKVPKQFQVQVEFIEFSQEQYDALMQEREAKADATSLRRDVQDLIRQKKAKMIESMMVVAPEGSAAGARNEIDFRYPEDYQVLKREEKDGVTSVYPKSFESVQLGHSCLAEVEVKGGQLSARLDVQLARLIDEAAKASARVPLIQEGELAVPKTQKLEISQAFLVQEGKYQHVATISPADDKGNIDASRKVMVFMKVDALK